LCEKSGAMALVLPGLMAGRQAGCLADKIVLNLENCKQGVCQPKASA